MSGRYFLQTFGCQMNMHDSDRMSEVLSGYGWQATSSVEDASLVVFNTCSVREKAEQKLRSEVGKLAALKRSRPDLIVAVTGCVAQQEGERLLQRVSLIDLVLGPDNLGELPALVEGLRGGSPRMVRTVFDLDEPRFLASTPSASERHAGAFITTMKGCDERCSFCIVPTTRGPERYRSSDEILREVEKWLLAGAREIVLLGQTVDSFRDPALAPPNSEDPDESQFPALLRKIVTNVPHFSRQRPSDPGLLRLRYTSPHPRHATSSLIGCHQELDVLAHHIHLPVQSGSDRVLRRMIRRYKRAEFIERAHALLRAQPDMTMSSDIIVGFPGETEEDFLETLSLVREVGFVQVFGFKFSPRPDTPALKLADDVPEEVKSERLARLFELVEAQMAAHLEKLVGSRATVLVEGASKTGDSVSGRTHRNEIVHVASECLPKGANFVGEVLEVEIVSANRRSLMGKATPDETERLKRTPSPTPRALSAMRSLPVLG